MIVTGFDEEDGLYQLALLTSFKGQAKKTLYSGKVCSEIADYGAIRHKFNTLHCAGQHISVMILTMTLKRISESPVYIASFE